IFKITTEDGRTIRTTGNHPYLVKQNTEADLFSSVGVIKNSQNVGDKNNSQNNVFCEIKHNLFALGNVDPDNNYQEQNASGNIEIQKNHNYLDGLVSNIAKLKKEIV
ncbi:MAG: hypothetical protein Q8L68_04360, partial [Methylococcales bacterium]|nr:hypothetical protein [Methylococcales bacterium]